MLDVMRNVPTGIGGGITRGQHRITKPIIAAINGHAIGDRLRLVNKVVPNEKLLETAEQYASMIMRNSQQAIRSAKETILDVVGRTLDDALRIETINAYSSLGDFGEDRERLSRFYSKGKTNGRKNLDLAAERKKTRPLKRSFGRGK
jgi:enoyl-CoA hydratase/carnithine racemase